MEKKTYGKYKTAYGDIEIKALHRIDKKGNIFYKNNNTDYQIDKFGTHSIKRGNKYVPFLDNLGRTVTPTSFGRYGKKVK